MKYVLIALLIVANPTHALAKTDTDKSSVSETTPSASDPIEIRRAKKKLESERIPAKVIEQNQKKLEENAKEQQKALEEKAAEEKALGEKAVETKAEPAKLAE